MDKPVHAASILGGKKLRDIEILHFTSDLRGHCARIKVGDFGNAGLSRDDILPDRGNPYPDRGDNPQPGNDDSTLRQIYSAIQKGWTKRMGSVSYTHLTLPTNRE